MRRFVMTMVVLGMLLGTTGVAMAHGYYGPRHGHGPRGVAYAPYRAGVGHAFRPYGAAVVVPSYGLGYGVPYGAGYGAGYGPAYGGYGAYPQIGFGINTGNFGLWYQQ